MVSLILANLSCGDSSTESPEALRIEAFKSIQQKEKELLEARYSASDTPRVEELCKLMLAYARNNPLDSVTPDMLFKAGELSIAIGQYDRAINMLNRVYNDFPEYEKFVEALYLVAFTYENHLLDKARAEEIYKQIIAKHPRHAMAIQSTGALELLYLTDKELLEKFSKNAAANP